MFPRRGPSLRSVAQQDSLLVFSNLRIPPALDVREVSLQRTSSYGVVNIGRDCDIVFEVEKDVFHPQDVRMLRGGASAPCSVLAYNRQTMRPTSLCAEHACIIRVLRAVAVVEQDTNS